MAYRLGPVSVVPTSPPVVNNINDGSTTQTFTLTFSAGFGGYWDDLGILNTLVKSEINGASSCYTAFNVRAFAPFETFYLVANDGSSLIAAPLGVPVSNSQCTVQLNNNYFLLPNQYVIQVTYTWSSAYQGSAPGRGDHVIWMAARTKSTPEHSSGWFPMGVTRTWPAASVGSIPLPLSLSLNPSYSTTTAQPPWQTSLSARWRKSSGSSFIGRWLLITGNVSYTRDSCYLAIPGSSGDYIYLIGDDGATPVGGINLLTGIGGPLENSQCVIPALPPPTRTVQGDDYQLNVTIQFKSAYKGNKIAYASTQTNTGNSGWQPVGLLSLGPGGVLPVTNTQVSLNQESQAWEPSATAGFKGDGTRVWSVAWNGFNQAGNQVQSARVAVNTGTGWQPRLLLPVGGAPLIDLFLDFNSSLSRIVYSGLASGNIYHGYNSDPTYSGFTSPALVASGGNWDYPSISVASPSMIIGAWWNQPGTSPKFHTFLSNNNGANWSALGAIPTASVPNEFRGPLSRVVATGGAYHAFIPVLDQTQTGGPNGSFPLNLPKALEYWRTSSGGTTFFYDSTLAYFGNEMPENNTTVPEAVFLAPFVDARASGSGIWAVSFSVGHLFGGQKYNNIHVCIRNRGCFILDLKAQHQMLAGTSVAPNGGVWVSYLELCPSSTNLVKKSHYFPPGSDPISATVQGSCPATNVINAASWLMRNRCPSVPGGGFCRAAGDYAGISSNLFDFALSPHINPPQVIPPATEPPPGISNALWANLMVDPPGEVVEPGFVPNLIPYEPGTVFGKPGDPLPATIGMPTRTRHADVRIADGGAVR